MMHHRLPPFLPRLRVLSLSIPALLGASASSSPPSSNTAIPSSPPLATMSTSKPAPPFSLPPTSFPTTPYTPRHTTWPYTLQDFLRADESNDTSFYITPRFVTHIDDNAISLLKKYYSESLPVKGRVLDLCSSWVSHFPRELEERVRATIAQDEKNKSGLGDNEDKKALEVVGMGMSHAELGANPILSRRILQDLNTEPEIPAILAPLDATICVVSIDYLTHPREVLASLLSRTRVGGTVHLVISNRCFPTKAVGRWLRIGEEERLQMVGDYLWWSGWRNVEIVAVCDGRVKEGEGGGGLVGWFGGGRCDPLWVVRGMKVEDSEAEGKSEL